MTAMGGFDIIGLVGQSNMVGRGVFGEGDPADLQDGGVFVFAPQGASANRIVPAKEPLAHWGTVLPATVGPATTFARLYADANPGRRVLLVPCAQGGTGFAAGPRRWSVTHTPAADNLYLRAVAHIRRAVAHAGPDSRVVGFLWHQGETDQYAPETYQASLDCALEGLRTEFTEVEVPWLLVGQMSPAGTALSTGRQTINAVHVDTPRRFHRTAFAPAPYGLHNPGDPTHLSVNGQRAMGRSFFDALPLAVANVPAEPPLPPSNVRAALGAPGVLRVTWDRPACRFTDFTLEHRPAGSETWLAWSHTASLNNTADLPCYTVGAPVEVRVATVNETGVSDFTAPVTLSPTVHAVSKAPSSPWRVYALRRVVEGYTGACLRVQRASDNTTLDVGFTPDGELDESALRAFCAGTDGHVRVWFSQTSLVLNGDATIGNQPQIVANGQVLKENGRPCVSFDGTSDYLWSTTTGMSTGPVTITAVAHFDVSGGDTIAPRWLGEYSTTDNNPMYSHFITSPTGVASLQERNNAATNVVATSSDGGGETDPWAIGRLACYSFTDSGSTVQWVREEREHDPFTTPTRTGAMTLNRFAVGAMSRVATTNYTKMLLSELYVWQENHNTSDLAALHADIAERYSLDGIV